MEYLRSLRWADYLFFALTDPRRLVARIADTGAKPLAGGVAIALMAAISEILSSSLIMVNTRFFYYKMSYGLLLMLIYVIVKTVITAGLIDLICQFLDFRGSVRVLLGIVLYSLFPQVFFLPLVYIVKVLGFAPPFFFAVFSLGLFAWSALITVTAVSELHSIPFSKAALIFLFPYVFIGVMTFMGVILLSMSLFGYFSTM